MQDDVVSLLVGSVSHDLWESYRIDSDLLVPADDWEVSIGHSEHKLPASVVKGAAVQVQIDGTTVLSGFIDEIDEQVSLGAHSIKIVGRDYGGVLTHCSAPIFSSLQTDLPGVVANVVRPLGISKIQVNGAGKFERVSIDPGEAAWDVLARAAEACGLWPWFQPDGTLVVGGPDYTVPVVANLYMHYDGSGNNVESVGVRDSIVNRYSDVIVLGQSHGTTIQSGNNAIMAHATDPDVPVYRPLVVIDSESTSSAMALHRANKMLADARLDGFDLSVTVRGHRLSSNGLFWTPGQRVYVYSEPHGIDGIFFLMGRTFERLFSGGTLTHLRFKEDGVWCVDALPSTAVSKKRQVKNPKLQIFEPVGVTQ